MSNSSIPSKAEWVKELEREALLGEKLIALLQNHCGETGRNEGAVDTLKRILKGHKERQAKP